MIVNNDRASLLQRILAGFNGPVETGLLGSSFLRTDITLKHLLINQSGTADDALEVIGAPAGFRQVGDAEDRIQLDPVAGIELGGGSDALDWLLSRTAASKAALGIDDTLAFGSLGTMSLNADDSYGLAERTGAPLPSRKQSATTTGNFVAVSGVATGTLSVAAVAGNLLVFAVTADAASTGTPTFSTPAGWTAVAATVSGALAEQVFYKVAAGGETSVATTITPTASDVVYWNVTTVEVQNINLPVLDQVATATGADKLPQTGTTLATTQAQEYELGVFSWLDFLRGNTFSNITNGFTKVRSSNSSNQVRQLVVDKVVTATGVASSGCTIATAASWVGRIVTFKYTVVSAADPAAPPAGVRKAYAKTTGLYAETSAAVVERLSEPGLATPVVSQYSNATAAYTAISTFTVPSNFLVAGRGTTFGIDLVGVVDNTVTSGTFTIALIWGGVAGVVLATVAVISSTTAAAGRMWTLRGLVTCRTAGASGVLQSSLAGFESSSTTTGVKTLVGSDVNTTAIDTTVNKDLVVAAKWSAAVAGNIVKCDICPGFILEKY